MTQNPIPRALSILFTSQTRALLMGGQACILYGAAEFSRDIDLAILVSPENLDHLRAALKALQAEPIYFPRLTEEVLRRGHACHFRCRAAEGLRIDVMGRWRGMGEFSELWERRIEIDLPEVGQVAVMAVEDLVKSKKTQRDKDWPMIRRLLEVDFYRHGLDASTARVRFWLAEGRTPEILQVLAEKYPEFTREAARRRPLLSEALAGDAASLARMLREEEDQERALDRQYWAPLKEELERWRRQ
ncbi:MAG: hypothetical protein HYW07_01185 [Candidatus Latescibacteria bacterium]|nr:hypothetical protein [Candidatus Latescibacterota bacterium]